MKIDCEHFPFSGEKKDIHYYKCFYHNSSDSYYSADELITNADNWDENQIRIWYFFYQPNFETLQTKQHEQIKELSLIHHESRRKESEFGIFFWALLLIIPTIFYIRYIAINQIIPGSEGETTNIIDSLTTLFLDPFSLIMAIIILLLSILIVDKKEDQKNISNEAKENINSLNLELKHLKKQSQNIVKNQLGIKIIEKLLWKNISQLESFSLKELSYNNEQDIFDNTPEFYKKIRKDSKHIPLPNFPVILTWGLAQISQDHKNLRENRLLSEFFSGNKNSRLSTWEELDKNKPFFRIWHLQFLFFQEKILEIVSFYFDFITKERFLLRVETYHYNHITHYAYSDHFIDYKKDELFKKIERLPDSIKTEALGRDVKLLTFSSSSGGAYTCILPSENIKDWLLYDNDIGNIDLSKLTAEQKKKLLDKNAEYESTIFSNIASESFNELRDKVESFAIREKTVDSSRIINAP